MKRLFLILATLPLLFNACSIKDRIDTKASVASGDMIDVVIKAVFEDDADTIYAQFAPRVQEADKDLKSNIQEFIDFFEGDYESMKVTYGHESEGRDHYTAVNTYKVTTTEKEYYILFEECEKFDEESDNGLISIGVQEAEDYDEDECLYYQFETAYVVTKDNHEEYRDKFSHMVGRDDIIVEINEENFPDETFRNYVLENFDNDVVDGKLSRFEISYNDSILLDGSKDERSGVKNLAGIEYLEGVTCIRINYSDVSDLNLSNNSKLEVLAIEHTKIKSIDLSNCPNMRILQCDSQVEVIGYDGIKHQKHADD